MGKKWDGDATPAEKLLSLFSLLLFNNRAYSLTELTGPDKLNMSKPSVTRLIRQLESSGIGCIQREMRGREAYYRLERPSRIPEVSLNPEMLNQLVLCRELLASVLPEAMQREMQAGIGQMASLSPQGAEGMGSGLGAAIIKGRIDYGPHQQVIAALMQAIHGGKVCTVRYKSMSGAEKEYSFAPKRILLYRECLYAEGWRVTGAGLAEPVYDEAWRLAVQRLKSCEVTERSSEGLPDPSAPDNRAFGFMEDEPFDVAVRFAPSVAPYVSEREWSRGQTMERHDDGSITLHARMFNGPECISWVLGFRDDAEVLEPEWLRREMKSTLARMRKMYRQ